MRKSLSFWIVVLAVFGTVNMVHVSDARSETFWERYFGGSADEDKAKPKHVFLQPENGRSGTSKTKTATTSKTDLNEVNKKLKEAEGKNVDGAVSAELAAKSSVMKMNVQRAQVASEKYEAAQKLLKQYEGLDYSSMSSSEQTAYNNAMADLRAAEADLNHYMQKIEK